MRVPFPSTESGLAKARHMYICVARDNATVLLAKCQSFKGYHLVPGSEPICRLTEHPDSQRNPFRKPTLIDLDKLFVAPVNALDYTKRLNTGISDELLQEILLQIEKCLPQRISLAVEDLVRLNT